ncbi:MULTISPECIES: DUF3842 family protein [Desulfofundulus]|uniref:DUF3842 family protein n=1 Tax=Desulfofundulus australicus DSM 11792 TaxID=1121425 RepID=A0A1M4ZMN6_9FIRM|nr:MULTISPECIES: DUF3842 family protein [Desulfofundulus]MBE3586298.1 DUF3842 family protein [Thermoanaerobacter sp.]MCS5695762.1 DUF3842 family protein [Desulfofundulus thermocisternus]MDK2887224.1 hypothetical protein [Thermoanaerobacter sp.]SHF19370.1 protein of unknown function [Desulfofundulus australicus DSM 11792]
MRIAVVDGQGGGIGKHIMERLRRELPEDVEILALGTNALATSMMLRAGANEGATGENAVIFNAPRVDLIVGPVSILFPHAMMGELTPSMATAIAASPAKKILLPLVRGSVELVGLRAEPLPHLIEELVQRVKEYLGEDRH